MPRPLTPAKADALWPAGKDNYVITAVVSVHAAATPAEAKDTIQTLYDNSGLAGLFTVKSRIGDGLFLVEFERFVYDDIEVVNDRLVRGDYPAAADVLPAVLKDQFLAEWREGQRKAVVRLPIVIQADPVFGNVAVTA